MALKDNLISVWELSEASGNALDAHGSNDLTETSGTIGAAAGPSGLDGSRDFEAGDTECFAIASNSELLTGDIDFTLQAWIYLESQPADGASYVIVGKDTDSPTNSRDYTLDYNRNDSQSADWGIRWYIKGGGTAILRQGAYLNTGQWYHIIVYHDSTNDLLGLVIDNGTPATAGTGGVVPDTGSANFKIGARDYASFEGYFDGLIAQVALWKRVLTSDERTALYNSGNGLPYADWDAGTAYDRSYSELLGLGNPYQRIAPSSRAYAVNAGSADAFARLSTANRTLLESLGNSDAYARIVESSRALAEILGVSEAVALERILGESGVITWRLRSNPQSPEGSVWELSPN